MRRAGFGKNQAGKYLCPRLDCPVEKDYLLRVTAVLNSGSRGPIEVLCSNWLTQLDGLNLEQDWHHSAETAGPRRLSSDLSHPVHVQTADRPLKKLAD